MTETQQETVEPSVAVIFRRTAPPQIEVRGDAMWALFALDIAARLIGRGYDGFRYVKAKDLDREVRVEGAAISYDAKHPATCLQLIEMARAFIRVQVVESETPGFMASMTQTAIVSPPGGPPPS